MSFDEVLNLRLYYESLRIRSLYLESQENNIAKTEGLISEIKGYSEVIVKIKSNLITQKINLIQEKKTLEGEYDKVVILKNLDEDKKDILVKFYYAVNHIYTFPDIYERIIITHWKRMIEDKDILMIINDTENTKEVKELVCSHILERYQCP